MSTNRGALKAIAPVPTANDFLDIVLSKTQRKTPTQIHKGFKISRIRSFYMRKVKFAQDAFHEKLDAILTEFPILNNLHPFLSSLLNVLYDKNHYKLALGQLSTARHLIDNVGKEYARLLKFGDSLYRCKQLKKAALGRMATIMKRQKDSLIYLEQVRQHISRLPSIDPTTRTLIVCGYPNVGKSSFVNKVTRANVEVQPYAFTTKSLFVGHLDYEYSRWQVIDTPGILDHPLEEMNTIEMQSITALAHLRSTVLYFMDLSEQCGYSFEAQCQLFQSIKPLFSGKPTFIVINKIDIARPADLDSERKALLDSLLVDGVTSLEVSCHSEEGVNSVKNAACAALLAQRIQAKEKSKRVDSIANRIRVAVPVLRDELERKPFIPEGISTKRAYDTNDPTRRKLEKDLEEEAGGAGVFVSDLRSKWMLKEPEWRYDTIPEIVDGKNLADFIDPDIEKRLEELEMEEEDLQKEGFYDSDSEDGSETEALKSTAVLIRHRKSHIRVDKQHRKDSMQNQAPIPRPKQHRTVDELISHVEGAGLDSSHLRARIGQLNVNRKRKRANEDNAMEVDGEGWEDEDDSMQVDEDSPRKKVKTGKLSSVVMKGQRLPAKNRATGGLTTKFQSDRARKIGRFAQRHPNRMARAGEADRHVPTKMPKHLFAGKRKSGKTTRR